MSSSQMGFKLDFHNFISFVLQAVALTVGMFGWHMQLWSQKMHFFMIFFTVYILIWSYEYFSWFCTCKYCVQNNFIIFFLEVQYLFFGYEVWQMEQNWCYFGTSCWYFILWWINIWTKGRGKLNFFYVIIILENVIKFQFFKEMKFLSLYMFRLDSYVNWVTVNPLIILSHFKTFKIKLYSDN